MTRKRLLYTFIALAILFVLAELTLLLPQFKPTNPLVTFQVNWDSPQTEAIFRESCADCHSNETIYPWYSYVVPIAWLVNNDVREGRKNFNISTGNIEEAEDIEDVVMDGEMPLAPYLITHPDAALTDEEKRLLIRGMENSLGDFDDDRDDRDDEREEDRRDDSEDDN
jgi:mono/diheme cytochrome c family protein